MIFWRLLDKNNDLIIYHEKNVFSKQRNIGHIFLTIIISLNCREYENEHTIIAVIVLSPIFRELYINLIIICNVKYILSTPNI